MKNGYEVRAQKFIQKFYEFYAENIDIDDACFYFNSTYHNQKIHVESGATRHALITSDYVIKIDKKPNGYTKRFGTCKTEYKNYQIAVRDGFEYMFAKITVYKYMGITWYIMPRVKGIGDKCCRDATYYMTKREKEWIAENGFFDLHYNNYGWKNRHIVLIDYASRDE